MRVYITRANSMKILRKLDLSNLNIEGAVYSKPIFFLNKREEQALLAYKEFVMNPEKFIEEANENGTEVFITAAGMAAALPGVVASQTVTPVIGVPLSGSVLDGMDALMSIVQMPPGIPVATVAINGGKNAAYLALQIIAVKHPEIKEKLLAHRVEMEEAAMKANKEVIERFA